MEKEDIINEVENLKSRLKYCYNRNKEIKEKKQPLILLKDLYLCHLIKDNTSNTIIFRNMLIDRIQNLKNNMVNQLNT